MKCVWTSLFVCALSAPVYCANYYIDHATGSNDADGLTPETAWKHCPGDKQARGIPANIKLQPGDVVTFKGGVRYFGEIKIQQAGAEGNPITFDGNSAGTFGKGRAILDGSQIIRDWQPVQSAEQVQGNKNWEKIMYTDVDLDLTKNFNSGMWVLHRDRKPDRMVPWQRIYLIDGEKRVLPIAQEPKPEDPFYPDLPKDFYKSPTKVTNNYPYKVYYEEGTIGNRSLPLVAITYGGSAPVIEPFNGGKFSIEMNEPARVTEIGIKVYRPKTMLAPEHVVFYADDEEVYTAEIDTNSDQMQRFILPIEVEASKLSYQLKHNYPKAPRWIKLQQVAAYDEDGNNLIKTEMNSILEDKERFSQQDKSWYDDVFVGLHAGNNHVYFGRVTDFDSQKNQLHTPFFHSSTYATTEYALYNSPKFISLPGEWCVAPLEGGKTRIYLLPERLEKGQAVNVGFPVLRTAITLDRSSSYIDVKGFLIQSYAGAYGGIHSIGSPDNRVDHINIENNEIRFISGHAGINLNYMDHVKVANNHIHHCPGWTVGIYVNRTKNYSLIDNRIAKNAGSGVRHYDAHHGVIKGNAIVDHYGMHSSGVNFYEGCKDILFEQNYVQNVIAINRSAENLTLRNNVIDSQKRSAYTVAMWGSGRIGGTFIKDVTIEQNTIVNLDPEAKWGSSIFVQRAKSIPQGLVIRNNVLDFLEGDYGATIQGDIQGNIFMRKTEAKNAGKNSLEVADPNQLFMDSAKGDYRRKEGGPQMDAGATLDTTNLLGKEL
ncbi:MAG: right-handed parallel beta-helix repeat-containing protein [Lentisphaeria bacterium]|nr:right-handed parallel beta-helix repeat-containing protein [Lentisphaeria bacterium]